MPAVLLDAYTDWVCPACGYEERTRPLPNRFHTCPKLHCLTAPLVRAGSDCTLVATLREDYIGSEIQQRGDDGRPYMNVSTVRGDGSNDLIVFAPCAQARLEI